MRFLRIRAFRPLYRGRYIILALVGVGLFCYTFFYYEGSYSYSFISILQYECMSRIMSVWVVDPRFFTILADIYAMA